MHDLVTTNLFPAIPPPMMILPGAGIAGFAGVPVSVARNASSGPCSLSVCGGTGSCGWTVNVRAVRLLCEHSAISIGFLVEKFWLGGLREEICTVHCGHTMTAGRKVDCLGPESGFVLTTCATCCSKPALNVDSRGSATSTPASAGSQFATACDSRLTVSVLSLLSACTGWAGAAAGSRSV